MINRSNSHGFTLIELAIVLVIIGVLVGSFIGTFTARVENLRVTETENELEDIKNALIGYAYVNGYLPCPDCIGVLCDPVSFRDGTEDRNAGTGACDTGGTTGFLPWVTLGLGEGDAWNTHYRYWVDPTYALDNTVPNSSFTLTSANGTGRIQEPDYDTDPTGATLKDTAVNVAAVIYSHGKNSFGGFSTANVFKGGVPVANIDEQNNINNDTIFVSRPPTTEDAPTAGGEFDDIVDWLPEFELKAKMVEAGVLP